MRYDKKKRIGSILDALITYNEATSSNGLEYARPNMYSFKSLACHLYCNPGIFDN